MNNLVDSASKKYEACGSDRAIIIPSFGKPKWITPIKGNYWGVFLGESVEQTFFSNLLYPWSGVSDGSVCDGDLWTYAFGWVTR